MWFKRKKVNKLDLAKDFYVPPQVKDFWKEVEDSLPQWGDWDTREGWIGMCFTNCSFLLGDIPNGFKNAVYQQSEIKGGCRLQPEEMTTQWMKQHPEHLTSIKIAITNKLVHPVPTDVVAARMHLSSELATLQMSPNVSDSLEKLIAFVRSLEQE
jgi:hypothetical protein